MDNRFFSLIVVPDSGTDVKYSSFNSQFLVAVFGFLIVAFFVCLFFIVGYHIKLRQENTYKTATGKKHELLAKIHQSESLLGTLTEKLDTIQKSDNAYRLYASMRVLDHDMYQGGVGGRVIFDRSELSSLSEEMLTKMELITYGVTKLDYQASLERISLGEIQVQLRRNREIIDNTPTIWPAYTPYLSITSGYGNRMHPITGRYQFHDAIDIDGRRGDKIIAAADGMVTTAEWKGNLGQAVIIQHKYGYETTYGHLDAIQVKAGQTVKKGQVIGAMGATGRATGVHLHYGISRNGQVINPRMLLRAAM
ncbi:MAG: M23 family metallopeptidase [Candidatus Latescibacterota bacterium]